eukprot:CAMPEP_0115860016 /NCGR_PEP_ID=MMETSP0287-20121206/16910_1 /TAXON_ID=412157 /ORGANISM="Chrysochromulina rotalis, Strain UIO044" /LENGTH=205 /DNA_ID=CAMNT_0003314327 /DNA_START=363 /DNA_END=979 /DNA_ORIENTATION=+
MGLLALADLVLQQKVPRRLDLALLQSVLARLALKQPSECRGTELSCALATTNPPSVLQQHPRGSLASNAHNRDRCRSPHTTHGRCACTLCSDYHPPPQQSEIMALSYLRYYGKASREMSVAQVAEHLPAHRRSSLQVIQLLPAQSAASSSVAVLTVFGVANGFCANDAKVVGSSPLNASGAPILGALPSAAASILGASPSRPKIL